MTRPTRESFARIADREQARLEAEAKSHEETHGYESPVLVAQGITAGKIAARIRSGVGGK